MSWNSKKQYPVAYLLQVNSQVLDPPHRHADSDQVPSQLENNSLSIDEQVIMPITQSANLQLYQIGELFPLTNSGPKNQNSRIVCPQAPSQLENSSFSREEEGSIPEPQNANLQLYQIGESSPLSNTGPGFRDSRVICPQAPLTIGK